MLSNLSQPHTMTYLSSHPQRFYKKVLLKIGQNSQENTCARISFSSNFNKKEALAQVVSCKFTKFSRTYFLQNTFGGCFWTYIPMIGKFWGWLGRLFFFGWCKNLNPGNVHSTKKSLRKYVKNWFDVKKKSKYVNQTCCNKRRIYLPHMYSRFIIWLNGDQNYLESISGAFD